MFVILRSDIGVVLVLRALCFQKVEILFGFLAERNVSELCKIRTSQAISIIGSCHGFGPILATTIVATTTRHNISRPDHQEHRQIKGSCRWTRFQ